MLSLAAASAESAPTTRKPLTSFVLSDQYGNAHNCELGRGKITVLMIADREGYEAIDDWVRALRAQYGSRLAYVGVSDVAAVPATFRSIVRNGIKKKFKQPILLDWQGKLVRSLPVAKKLANIFVVGGDGAIVTSVQGSAGQEKVLELCSQIDNRLEALTSPAQ